MPEADFEVVGLDDVLEMLRKAPERSATALSSALNKVMWDFRRYFQKKQLRARSTSYSPRGARGSRLARRTGALSRALTHHTNRSKSLSRVWSKVGWWDPHAAMIAWVHEEGRTIRRKGKYLTVPVGHALTAAGKKKRPSVRDWENTFVIRSKKTGALLVMRKVSKNVAKPIYVLREQVYIPPRLRFRRTWKQWYATKGLQKLHKVFTEKFMP